MNEFKITVEIPGLSEAINNLAEAIKAQHNAPVDKTSAAPVTDTAAQNNAAPTATTAPTTAPAQETAAAPSAPVPSEKAYSLDDLSRAGATLIDQGKMPQLLELLGRYGVQAVTQLDTSAYPAFVNDLKALGAQLG